jgi:outer membrane protein OmpA-like peptidoglycan-associated protein
MWTSGRPTSSVTATLAGSALLMLVATGPALATVVIGGDGSSVTVDLSAIDGPKAPEKPKDEKPKDEKPKKAKPKAEAHKAKPKPKPVAKAEPPKAAPPPPAPEATPAPAAESAATQPPPAAEPAFTPTPLPEPAPAPKPAPTETPTLAPPAEVAALGPATVEGSKVKGDAEVPAARVGFDAGADAIGPDAAARLDALVAASGSATNVIQVKAYAAGTPETNSAARRLSLRRAVAVRSYLIQRGMRATRIDVRALGIPADDGPADRVDVIIMP